MFSLCGLTPVRNLISNEVEARKYHQSRSITLTLSTSHLTSSRRCCAQKKEFSIHIPAHKRNHRNENWQERASERENVERIFLLLRNKTLSSSGREREREERVLFVPKKFSSSFFASLLTINFLRRLQMEFLMAEMKARRYFYRHGDVSEWP
jgi:hypothetical protein